MTHFSVFNSRPRNSCVFFGVKSDLVMDINPPLAIHNNDVRKQFRADFEGKNDHNPKKNDGSYEKVIIFDLSVAFSG